MDTVVYLGIGNSDDKLTQAEWSEFCEQVGELADHIGAIRGAWYSLPHLRWQNACWCIELFDDTDVDAVKGELARLAQEYHQDSISWAEATTEFITPPTETPA